MTTTRLSRGFWQEIQHADPDANFAVATPMHQLVELSRRLLMGYFRWPISHEPGSINSVHFLLCFMITSPQRKPKTPCASCHPGN